MTQAAGLPPALCPCRGTTAHDGTVHRRIARLALDTLCERVGGISGAARTYGARYGIAETTALRLFVRLTHGAETPSEPTLDRLASLAGLDDYFEEVAS